MILSVIGGHLIKKKKFSSAQTTNVSLFEMPPLFCFPWYPIDNFSTGTLCWVTLRSLLGCYPTQNESPWRCLMIRDLEKWPSKQVVPGLWSTRMQTYDMIKTIMGAHLWFRCRESVLLLWFLLFSPNLWSSWSDKIVPKFFWDFEDNIKSFKNLKYPFILLAMYWNLVLEI